MSEIQDTTAIELPEITKEAIEARANAYAETLTSELKPEAFKAKCIAKIKTNWYDGFLTHVKLMEPHNEHAIASYEDLYKKFNGIYDEVDKCRSMLGQIAALVEKLDGYDLFFSDPSADISTEEETWNRLKSILKV